MVWCNIFPVTHHEHPLKDHDIQGDLMFPCWKIGSVRIWGEPGDCTSAVGLWPFRPDLEDLEHDMTMIGGGIHNAFAVAAFVSTNQEATTLSMFIMYMHVYINIYICRLRTGAMKEILSIQYFNIVKQASAKHVGVAKRISMSNSSKWGYTQVEAGWWLWIRGAYSLTLCNYPMYLKLSI